MNDSIPSHLKYTKEHEWAWLQENNIVIIGITQHACQQLGDVVYLELPEEGKLLEKDKVFGVVESVKAVSDLFSPVSGKVIAVNTALVEHPESINQDPYEKAWMLKISMEKPDELGDLMDNESYKSYIKEYAK